MSQIVPTGNYSTDAYAAYAENFDLSLLSMDNESSLRSSAQLPYLTPEYIPTTVYEQTIKIEKDKWIDSPVHDTSELLGRFQQISDNISHQFHHQFYSSPLPSPPQEQFITVFPPSPAPSIEQQINFNIKQEYILFPPSPPDSNGAPSPRCDIKSEPDTDIEASIDIDSLLQKSFEALEPKKQDHQLLREYLQDTSFQRKHNLKPLALESLLGGWGSRGDIEPVISLALEHAKRDIQQTCATLNISPDPQQWTCEQVQSWLQSTIAQFKLPPVHDIERLFPEDGVSLSRLTDEEFIRRVPQVGGTLHAQLEVWKAACNDSILTGFSNPVGMTSGNGGEGGSAGPSSIPWSPAECPSADPSDDEDEEMPVAGPIGSNQPSTSIAASVTAAPSTTTHQSSTSTAGSGTSPIVKPTRQGSHIHLWQFLKELLASPQIHGTSIRWLDRPKGVFKIEDSVRVARLWGRRKNRPAMNYDKLSRSIRQYYKKGIMKKTERSQRLVYQFCHPYNL